jgi:hypothetical protein
VPSRRLDDRIRDLCAKAVTTPDAAEFSTLIKELNRALHEHTRRLRKLAAALHGPLDQRFTTRPEVPQPPVHLCSICGQPTTLELDKVDEDGQPMHEACYLMKLTYRRPLIFTQSSTDT